MPTDRLFDYPVSVDPRETIPQAILIQRVEEQVLIQWLAFHQDVAGLTTAELRRTSWGEAGDSRVADFARWDDRTVGCLCPHGIPEAHLAMSWGSILVITGLIVELVSPVAGPGAPVVNLIGELLVIGGVAVEYVEGQEMQRELDRMNKRIEALEKGHQTDGSAGPSKGGTNGKTNGSATPSTTEQPAKEKGLPSKDKKDREPVITIWPGDDHPAGSVGGSSVVDPGGNDETVRTGDLRFLAWLPGVDRAYRLVAQAWEAAHLYRPPSDPGNAEGQPEPGTIISMPETGWNDAPPEQITGAGLYHVTKAQRANLVAMLISHQRGPSDGPSQDPDGQADGRPSPWLSDWFTSGPPEVEPGDPHATIKLQLSGWQADRPFVATAQIAANGVLDWAILATR